MFKLMHGWVEPSHGSRRNILSPEGPPCPRVIRYHLCAVCPAGPLKTDKPLGVNVTYDVAFLILVRSDKFSF